MNVRTSRTAPHEAAHDDETDFIKAARKVRNGAAAAAAEAIDEVADEIADDASELEAQLRASGERLLESARQIGDIVSRQAKEHPLAACGIAFVAGIAVARMMRR